jgi:DNA-binding CsgD family transcriptional regulator
MSLPRERLIALLADSALTSVELVIAPPGFGKTTLLREYASAETGVVFVALPEATDLEAFVRSVIAAVVPSALRSIGAVFEAPATENIEERAGKWLVSRLREFSGTLIVDDFHRTVDERIARLLAATISATHGQMHWIVASRESPPFPMGSWIARGWMGLPLTSDDLAFTLDEAAALAASLGIDISSDALNAIVEDTLGWPIGVRLALSLVSRNRGIGQTRVQTRGALFALIEDEVWKPLETDLRELIAAAVLMPTPGLATLEAAGFMEARAAMERVVAKVPFIHAIDDDVFAIHDLFREFVATQTSKEPANRIGAAERMGTALVASGSPADGLRLLIEANDVAGISNTLGSYALDLLETGQRSVVNTAVTFLSDHGLNDSGIVLAIRGVLAFSDGSISNSTNLFVRALERDAPPAIRAEISRRLAVNYANRRMLREALETLKPLELDPSLPLEEQLEITAMSTAFLAAEGLQERDAIDELIASVESQMWSVRPSVQTRLLQRLSTAAYYNSSFEKAESLAQDAALLASDLGMDRVAALAYGTLYSIAAIVDPDETRSRFFSRSQAAAAERAADSALRVYALRVQYIIAALDVDEGEANAIEALLSTLVDSRAYREAAIFREARALLYLASGDLAKAEGTLRSMPMAALTPSERVRCESLLLLIVLLRGKRSEAAAAFERGLLSEAPSAISSRTEMAYAYAFRGLAYWVLDRPAQARKAFEFNTLTLPPRDDILLGAFKALSLMQHPLPNSSAINDLYDMLADAGFRAYGELLKLLAELDANDVELSAAELETLREFDRFGGRAADVAKALGKSKFTVQNQIQSAIKKLGCSGRAEALAYARQRGWLDRASN